MRRDTPITKMFAARRRAGLSQAELARRLGVTQPRISAWETRTADIPAARRWQLYDELGVLPEELDRDA